MSFRLNYDANHSSAVDHKTKFMKELHKLIRDIFPKGKFQKIKSIKSVELSGLCYLLKKLNVHQVASNHVWGPQVMSYRGSKPSLSTTLS